MLCGIMDVINLDFRIPLELVDISEIVKDEEFKVFSEPAKKKDQE